MSSFLKYVSDEDVRKGNGRGQLHFGRAHLDGVPYRGRRAVLKESEYDEYTESVQDGHVRLFDLSDEEQLKALTKIIDRAANGWYCIYRMTEYSVPQSDGSLRLFVYCVWIERYRELAEHRVPANVMLPNGA